MSMDTESNPSTPTDSDGSAVIPTDTNGDAKPKRIFKPSLEKKMRVGPKHALAIGEVHRRKQVSYHVNYRNVATEYNVHPGNLRRLYSWWKRGFIELPPDLSVHGKPIDDHEMIVQARALARRDVAVTLAVYERKIFAAEDAKVTGPNKKGMLDRLLNRAMKELNQARRDLQLAMETVQDVDKGFDEYLNQRLADIERQKLANPANPIPQVVDKTVRELNDHDRGLEALRKLRDKEREKTVEAVVVEEPKNGG